MHSNTDPVQRLALLERFDAEEQVTNELVEER